PASWAAWWRSWNARASAVRPTSPHGCESPTMFRNPLIVAADCSDLDEAERLAEELSDVVAYVKVGLELFTAGGPEAVARVRRRAPVFLDLKLHDIPTTVRRAARNAALVDVELLSVHALGGPDMVSAAVEGAAD